ncbi:MAG: 2-C-methyl-D-erythritol 2,4-cyclodiphosphate synthase [Gammaproteobacteria bacterium]|nr:2-C-methyl-D-erythritol 2,4-cyclodiphosphate synthase [Gammaproteobacteria bacterium]CAJ2376672.1 MAG: 2-C-methyl-D-erythritol 2,4-cyclodiphosphate synthase [Arenicellales bacterium IbO2]MDA7961589.1 2-C-methyl-D-erythritol 2,4-cyclodiphosphate synthase [Gammaproteobacteria bacterium]MDA7969278.1 2-C-methyl-D-erythritol 2,4-cyclodiphosphate synthase [Gammaproteobacteria bacterium]MDA7994739.1 2-C-methyl-D-erythritol 2,4-cyclodiphosphate synthase [Gammaproteobacteria bacterium]
MNWRIGNGYDAHRFAPEGGRELRIGGVRIEWPRGLAGHSDADVLLHAVCDACLGAAGRGDLGAHFPNNERYRGADSRGLLREVRRMLDEARLRVMNIDCVVVAERPKLAPHTAAMARNIAEDLGADAARVNVKATSTDGLGFCGREEGIAAHAVALLAGSG